MSESPRLSPDLLAVAVLAVACAGCAYFPSAGPAQAPLGVMLGLGGVGYALACALWGPRRPSGTEMLLYSLALSLAGTIVVAVIVDLVGLPLTRTSLVASLVALTLIAVAAAWIRRPTRVRRATKLRSLALIAVAPVVVFVGAVIVLHRPIANGKVAGYTQLWSTRAGAGKIKVGLTNAEQRPGSYVVKVSAAHRKPVVHRLRLETGQSWSRELTVSPPGRRAAVAVSLFRAPELDHPYRTVSLAP